MIIYLYFIILMILLLYLYFVTKVKWNFDYFKELEKQC